jgi:hypothetical protein
MGGWSMKRFALLSILLLSLQSLVIVSCVSVEVDDVAIVNNVIDGDTFDKIKQNNYSLSVRRYKEIEYEEIEYEEPEVLIDRLLQTEEDISKELSNLRMRLNEFNDKS